MIAWKTSAWELSRAKEAAQLKLDARTSGMIAGTKVATAEGWTGVETIREGQRVLTFDGGLQTVVAITRHQLEPDATAVASWPMTVPAGVLGNREAMTILPNQPVMIESDMAEALTGDPFAVIPSVALIGFRGIAHVRPTKQVEVIQLHFEQDEIAFANTGALFLCHAKADLASDMAGFTYEVLSMDQAEDLVDCMVYGTEGRPFVPATQCVASA